ncbi:MAG TPA: hypothetical protein VEI49_02940 [Terriglobales bacterium]|nr:hypothetical protein [Terriglobales bacterium]
MGRAQEGRIVGVFVAGCELVDALAQKHERRMLNVAGIALTDDQCFKPGGEPQALVELPQQNQSGLAGDLATLKVKRESIIIVGWNRNPNRI